MNSKANKSIMRTTTEAEGRPSSSMRIAKKTTPVTTMIDSSTQARRISIRTVSDDLDELLARWMREVELIRGLKSRLTMFENENVQHCKELKELEEKERIESNRRKMRIRDQEIAKARAEEQRKWLLAAKEAKKLKDSEVARCKEVERQKELEEKKKLKEAEAKKLKEQNAKNRKEKIEKEKELRQYTKATMKKVTPDDWEKDFSFKKPDNVAPRKPRVYKVPGSPIPRYKKPYVARKETKTKFKDTIILSDDEAEKRTPVLERLEKRPIIIPKYPVHSKDLNFYKKVIEDEVLNSSESESESDDDDDSLFIEIPKKRTKYDIEAIPLFPVDMDKYKAGTSSQNMDPDAFPHIPDNELDQFLLDCDRDDLNKL